MAHLTTTSASPGRRCARLTFDTLEDRLPIGNTLDAVLATGFLAGLGQELAQITRPPPVYPA
jgi:hypothetical protein